MKNRIDDYRFDDGLNHGEQLTGLKRNHDVSFAQIKSIILYA
jgi:hypothetical protein